MLHCFFVLTFKAQSVPCRWHPLLKGFIIVWICFNALTVTCYASTYLDAVPYIQELFHIGSTVAKLGFTFYAGACGLGPLFLAPLCELYGRKWVYVGSALGWTGENSYCENGRRLINIPPFR